jgi:hypothetical protein
MARIEAEMTQNDQQIPIEPPPHIDPDYMQRIATAKRIWEQARKAREGKPVSPPPYPRLTGSRQ